MIFPKGFLSSVAGFVKVGLGLSFFGLWISGFPNVAQAEESGKDSNVTKAVFQSEAVQPTRMGRDLRDLNRVEAWEVGDPSFEIPRRITSPTEEVDGEKIPLPPVPRDPLLSFQENLVSRAPDQNFSMPDLNFEGLSFSGGIPPDTVGEVGANHYIQMVNSSVFTIFDKTGNLVVGPTALDSLWVGQGPCNNGRGDPIVVYDDLAERWVMSEFATAGNHLCVYVSQTSDPVSGGWFLYDFNVPQFPDYPKYAVWPDAYYVSSNESTPAAYALDRNQMLSGLPATFQRFTVPNLAFGFNALTPSDLDGANPPPAGSPNYFMRHRDDEIHNSTSNNAAQDFLEVYEFHVDFNNSANSTFTGPTNLPVSEFDSTMCGVGNFFCVPQPGTGTILDPITEVIMWRLQYRNFGTHETLIGNLRWTQIQQTMPGFGGLSFGSPAVADGLFFRRAHSLPMGNTVGWEVWPWIKTETLRLAIVFQAQRCFPLSVMQVGFRVIPLGFSPKEKLQLSTAPFLRLEVIAGGTTAP